jgi:hypothetical protein
MKNPQPSLMVHTTPEFATSNLILDFEFDQHLESHKHVINIIMGFRDMGCYNPPPSSTWSHHTRLPSLSLVGHKEPPPRTPSPFLLLSISLRIEARRVVVSVRWCILSTPDHRRLPPLAGFLKDATTTSASLVSSITRPFSFSIRPCTSLPFLSRFSRAPLQSPYSTGARHCHQAPPSTPFPPPHHRQGTTVSPASPNLARLTPLPVAVLWAKTRHGPATAAPTRSRVPAAPTGMGGDAARRPRAKNRPITVPLFFNFPNSFSNLNSKNLYKLQKFIINYIDLKNTK